MKEGILVVQLTIFRSGCDWKLIPPTILYRKTNPQETGREDVFCAMRSFLSFKNHFISSHWCTSQNLHQSTKRAYSSIKTS